MLEHGLYRGGRRNFFLGLCLGGTLLHPHPGQGAERPLADVDEQFLKHIEAFTLVFELGIALAVPAQADAVAQEIHVAQMFLPAPVQFLQQEVAQQIAVKRPRLLLELVEDGLHQFLRLLARGQRGISGEHAVDVHDIGQPRPHRLFLFRIAGRARDFHRGVNVVEQVRHVLVEDGIKIGLAHEIAAQGIDDGTLLVHDVVVVEQRLADFKVMAFHALLGVFDGPGNHVVLDGLAFLHPQLLHQPGKAVRTEETHQVVFEREVEARGAGVALTPGTAAQLVVDAAAFVAFGAEDVQAAEVDDAFTELDVRAAARHVGGDGHLARLSGLRDDFRFLHVMLGVEHVVRHARAHQKLRNKFRSLDGNGAHQHGLAGLVQFLDRLDNGLHLFAAGAVDEVGHVLADHGPVRGDGAHLKAVDLGEFHRFRIRGAGHARQLVVHAEVVLEGDARKRLVLRRDGDVLLGFEGLMQPVAETAPFHGAARELVDDDHLIALDDVVHVAPEHGMGLQGLQDVVLRRDVGGIVEVVDAEQFLDALRPLVGERGGLGFLVHGVVAFLLKLTDDLVHLLVQIGGFVGGAGDDERRAGFVDEDGVHFVDNGVMMAALHKLLGVKFHVVTQIVKAELVVRAVGDIRGIGRLALLVAKARHNDADAEAEEGVKLPHPFGVALGEVVVDRHHMHALAFQRVEHHGQRRHKGLAFAGLHFRDLALVQGHRAKKLHVEMPHPEDAAAGLTDQRENLRQDGVEVLLAGLHLFAVHGQALREFLVRKGLHFRLKRVDFCHLGPELFQKSFVFTAEYLAYKETYHENSQKRGCTAAAVSPINKTCRIDWQITGGRFPLELKKKTRFSTNATSPAHRNARPAPHGSTRYGLSALQLPAHGGRSTGRGDAEPGARLPQPFR